MSDADSRFRFPTFAADRGVGYWLRPSNLWAARYQRLRSDQSISWRRSFHSKLNEETFAQSGVSLAERSAPLSALVDEGLDKVRILILGDTGEGDCSQYALLPLIRALKPHAMIINGDVAYPAGRFGASRDDDDYLSGFFEPYRDLGIPVWAVPGNHEYYSPNNGREFFDTFCSKASADRWSSYGLRYVPQPGSYWSLVERGSNGNLVILGLDSGRLGNLDGHHSWWQVWKAHESRDDEQLGWLRQQLDSAKSGGARVIVMYHIPPLVNQANKGDVYMRDLILTLSEYSCVELIITAHTHNYQQYSPDVVAQWAVESQGVRPGWAVPHYILSGRGGAYLNSTKFGSSTYPCSVVFPTAEDWRDNTTGWARVVAGNPAIEKSVIGKVVSVLDTDSMYDADQVEYLSMLLLEIDRTQPSPNVKITPVFMDKLETLFDPNSTEQIDIQDSHPPVTQDGLRQCLMSDHAIRL